MPGQFGQCGAEAPSALGVAGEQPVGFQPGGQAMGGGAGRMLFEAATRLARRLGARRMAILADPNAAPFYERMGATVMPDWRICRVTGDALTAFAARGRPDD